jgi:hypothetical protein
MRRCVLVIFIATLALLGGCAASSRSVHDGLDPLTGVTVTYSKTPIVLYRENPAHAAYARNYLHLGPIEVNKSGNYKYYLWLGIWSTLQPNVSSERLDEFESIVVIADGEPLLLDSVGWTPASIETSVPVYPKPVATALDVYYRVTADQIRVIANARDLQLRTTGATPLEFNVWDEQKAARRDINEFLHRIFVQ